MRGMNEQVWKKLDEQGIGKVLAAIAAKVSVAGDTRPSRSRVNQVASTDMERCQDTDLRGKGPQGSLGVEDWKVVVSLQCGGVSEQHHDSGAKEFDTTVA
jgi:hypothetical protein